MEECELTGKEEKEECGLAETKEAEGCGLTLGAAGGEREMRQ